MSILEQIEADIRRVKSPFDVLVQSDTQWLAENRHKLEEWDRKLSKIHLPPVRLIFHYQNIIAVLCESLDRRALERLISHNREVIKSSVIVNDYYELPWRTTGPEFITICLHQQPTNQLHLRVYPGSGSFSIPVVSPELAISLRVYFQSPVHTAWTLVDAICLSNQLSITKSDFFTIAHRALHDETLWTEMAMPCLMEKFYFNDDQLVEWLHGWPLRKYCDSKIFKSTSSSSLDVEYINKRLQFFDCCITEISPPIYYQLHFNTVSPTISWLADDIEAPLVPWDFLPFCEPEWKPIFKNTSIFRLFSSEDTSKKKRLS